MRTYWKILLALVVLALVMSVQGIGLIVVLFTFGLGFPLVYAATGALALLCLYPFVRDRNTHPARGAMLSALLAAGVFAGPALLGEHQAGELALQAARDDIAAAGSAGPVRSLEIRRSPSDHGRLFDGTDACGNECRALLRSGRVDWVRVVMLDMRGKPQDARPVRLRLGRGQACAVPGMPGEAAETCILQAPDDGVPADLVLAFESGGRKLVEGLEDSRFASARRVWRATASRPGGGAPVMRRTAVDIRRPVLPAVLGPEFNGMNSEGIRLMRKTVRHGEVTLSAALEELGLDVDPAAVDAERTAAIRPPAGPATAGQTRAMLAVLDLPQKEPFSRDQARPVADWIMQVRQTRDWTPEQTELFRRVLRDGRIQSPTFADQVFVRNATLARQLMPDLLAVLEAEDGKAVYTQARSIAYRLPGVDPAVLAPHAARLASLARRNDRTGHAVMLSAGRLGIDPRPLLLPLAGDPETAIVRLRAACLAQDRWGGVLVPPLRDALETVEGKPGLKRDIVDRAARALARFGDADYLRSTLPRHGWDDRRIGKLLRRAGSGRPDAPAC